jgi:hypothetical protein
VPELTTQQVATTTSLADVLVYSTQQAVITHSLEQEQVIATHLEATTSLLVVVLVG